MSALYFAGGAFSGAAIALFTSGGSPVATAWFVAIAFVATGFAFMAEQEVL